MKIRGIVSAFFLAIAATAARADEPTAADLAALRELTGPELIARLQADATRSLAFFELQRRAGDKHATTFAEFEDNHAGPDVIP